MINNKIKKENKKMIRSICEVKCLMQEREKDSLITTFQMGFQES